MEITEFIYSLVVKVKSVCDRPNVSSDAALDLQFITEVCVYCLRRLCEGVTLCPSEIPFENNCVKDEHQTLKHT